MSADLQTIARFSDPIEAELACGRLLDEGLSAVITGDITANAFSLGYMTGGIELSVPGAEKDRAIKVLTDFAKEVATKRNPPKEAITAEPPLPALVEEPLTEEEVAALPNEAERITERAFRAALFGYLICWPILHVYGFLLLLYVAFSSEEVRSRYSSKYYVSFALCALSVVAAAIVTLGNAWTALPIGVAALVGVVMFLVTRSRLRGRGKVQ